VHLTTDPRQALETGRRHSPSVALLEVDTQCLKRRGIGLEKRTPTIYLAPHVPPECISVVEEG